VTVPLESVIENDNQNGVKIARTKAKLAATSHIKLIRKNMMFALY